MLPQLTSQLDKDTILRFSHSLTAISLAPGLTEITLFGGAPHFIPHQLHRDIQSMAAATVLIFSKFNWCFKVTGDSLHELTFISTKPIVSRQRKQLYLKPGAYKLISSWWSWNKHQTVADMVIKKEQLAYLWIIYVKRNGGPVCQHSCMSSSLLTGGFQVYTDSSTAQMSE